MKKVVAVITISLIIFVGCSQEKQEISSQHPSSSSIAEESTIAASSSDENTNNYWESYVETFSDYNFEGASEATFDDRHFKLDVLPQNIPEELVANNYYYDIAGEFENLSSIYGENEALKLSARNIRNKFQEKNYITEFVIKNLSVAKKDELKITKSPMTSSLDEYIEKYNLTEFTIIKVEVLMTYSQEAINRSPQLDAGTYVRSFLCGKSNEDKEWKIYEVYWE